MINIITALLYIQLLLGAHTVAGVMGSLTIVLLIVPITMIIRYINIFVFGSIACVCVDLYNTVKGNSQPKTEEEKDALSFSIIFLIVIGSIVHYNMV